jgi:hypothetical protein
MSDEQLNQQQVAIIRSMGGLVFDAVFEETHEAELEVTDNPVETGVVVSDHAFMKPLKVTLSAGVTDTPLAVATNDPFASDAGRSKRAYELLTELQKRAEPFDLQTGLKLYQNMICTSVRTSQDKDSDGALLFTATIREVIVVYTQVVQYPPRKAGATKRQAGAKKDKGEQQGTEVTDKPKKQSLAAKLKTAIGGKK